MMRFFLLFLEYNWDLVRHKVLVLYFGAVRHRGIPPWHYFTHDVSKYTSREYWQRFECFYLQTLAKDDPRWVATLWSHWRTNDHHLEHYLDERGFVRAMDISAVRHMVADWRAKSCTEPAKDPSRDRTVNQKLATWLRAEFPRMVMHPHTRARLIRELEAVGVPRECWSPVREPEYAE